MFAIFIETGNAAFSDEPGELEIARILQGIATDLVDMCGDCPTTPQPIRDSNGNTVGNWHWPQELRSL